MFRHLRRLTSTTLATFAKRSTSKNSTYKKVLDSRSRNWFFSISASCGIAHVYAQTNESEGLIENSEDPIENSEDIIEISEEEIEETILENNKPEDLIDTLEEEIRKAALQGEKYLVQLMDDLKFRILQTSMEYQECLINQIEITKLSTKIGPVGEHWDQLTAFRVKGKELKDELHKYEAMAMSIADIVDLEVQSSLGIRNEDILKDLHDELEKLQKFCSKQLQEVQKYEVELLAANRESILHGVR